MVCVYPVMKSHVLNVKVAITKIVSFILKRTSVQTAVRRFVICVMYVILVERIA